MDYFWMTLVITLVRKALFCATVQRYSEINPCDSKSMSHELSQKALVSANIAIILRCRNANTLRACKETTDNGKCNDVNGTLSIQIDNQKVAFHELK